MGDVESDEFEQPANEPLDKATSGERMTPRDWETLVRFTAAQSVRTPAGFLRSARRSEQSIPRAMDCVEMHLEARASGLELPGPPRASDSDLFPMSVTMESTADSTNV